MDLAKRPVPDNFVLPEFWVSRLQEACDNLQRLSDALRQRIVVVDADLDAYFLDDKQQITGAHARTLLADWICTRGFIERTTRYGTLAGSDDTLALVRGFNHAKETYADIYASIRAEAGADKAEQYASTLAHEALKAIGEHHTDFARVRSQVPLWAGTAADIRWYVTMESKSQRKTVAHAIAELDKEGKYAPEIMPFIRADLRVLSAMPPTTPVAYRRKTPVETLRVRYRGFDGDEWALYKASGNNPLLCSAFAPNLSLARPAPQREPGGGRPAIISDRKVSDFLHGWYWYDVPAKQAPTPTTPTQRTTRAPLISAIPEMTVRLKKERGTLQPYVVVSAKGLRLQTLVPDEGGLRAAWEMAVIKAHKKGLTTAPEAWTAACPTRADYQQWLTLI